MCSDFVGGVNQVRMHLWLDTKNLEQPSDPLGRAYKDSVNLRCRTHQCIETK